MVILYFSTCNPRPAGKAASNSTPPVREGPGCQLSVGFAAVYCEGWSGTRVSTERGSKGLTHYLCIKVGCGEEEKSN